MRLSSRSMGRARLAAWPVLELFMLIGVQIVLTPLLLHRLGSQQFGVWVIVQSLLLACGVLSLGAGAGSLPVLSAALHRGDVAGAGAAMRWLFRRVAIVSLTALGCLSIALALGWLPGSMAGAQDQLWPLALAALAWMTTTELDNAVSTALKAHDRFDVAAKTESAGRIAQLGLTAAWVDAGSSALVPILVALAVTVVKLLARLVALRRHVATMGAEAGDARAEGLAPRGLARELAVTGAWIWVGSLGSLAFTAFDRWFVGAWFGPAVLASYAVCIQLAQLPHAVVSAASQVLVPWAARNAGHNQPDDKRRSALLVLVGATALSALPSLLLLPLLEPLLGLWISQDFARDHLALAQGLTIAFLLLSLNAPGYFILLGMGQARRSTIVISVCGAVFVLGTLSLPSELSTFVVLKGLFAALALALPIDCALRLRAALPCS